jgi:hypothetical protein
MTRLRTAVLGAVLWCGVVVAVSSLVWVVIARAGQGVVPVSQPQADLTGSLPVPGHGHRSGHPSPGVTLSPRPSDSSSPTGTPPTTPVVPPPTSPASTPPPTGPQAERRSWSGAAGHVAAECRGSSASLVSAFPSADWRYTVLSRGPVEVRVRFTKTVGDDKSGIVAARCVSGIPHFSLSGDTRGDD